MNGWREGWRDGRTEGGMDACQHQWMDGIDGRINGCMCLRICTCIHECVVWTCNTHESLVREWRVTESARERERE